MKLKQAIWLALLFKALNWLVKNTDAKIYTSTTPVGSKLGGHDVVELQDRFLIFDARLAGRIIVLGYFQYS